MSSSATQSLTAGLWFGLAALWLPWLVALLDPDAALAALLTAAIGQACLIVAGLADGLYRLAKRISL